MLASPAGARLRGVRFFLLATTALWSLLGVAGALPAMFAVMMFDAPGSTSNVPTVALVGALMSFPIVCVVSVIETWASRRAGNDVRACWAACLPLVNLVVGGAAIAWIELVQSGRLAG